MSSEPLILCNTYKTSSSFYYCNSRINKLRIKISTFSRKTKLIDINGWCSGSNHMIWLWLCGAICRRGRLLIKCPSYHSGCRRRSSYLSCWTTFLSFLVLSCWTTLLKTIVKYYFYWIVCTWNMLLSLRMGKRVIVLWSVAAPNTIIFQTSRFVVIRLSAQVRHVYCFHADFGRRYPVV